MKIRKANLDDCAEVAKLHERSLTESFLGTLGGDFLNLIYRSLANFEQGIFLVAEDRESAIGFITGTMKTGKFYKHFLKRNFLKVIFILSSKLFKKNVGKKILETAKYSKKDLGFLAPDAELLSMAVTEEFQGKGVAQQLFERLAGEFHKKGIHEFKIIAGNKLKKANKFYQKMGCKRMGETEVHEGDISTVYIFRGAVK